MWDRAPERGSGGAEGRPATVAGGRLRSGPQRGSEQGLAAVCARGSWGGGDELGAHGDPARAGGEGGPKEESQRPRASPRRVREVVMA